MSNFRGGSQGKMGPRDWSGVGCGVARPAASRPVEGQMSALAAGWLLTGGSWGWPSKSQDKWQRRPLIEVRSLVVSL